MVCSLRIGMGAFKVWELISVLLLPKQGKAPSLTVSLPERGAVTAQAPAMNMAGVSPPASMTAMTAMTQGKRRK